MAQRRTAAPLPQVAAIYARVSSEEQARNGKTSLDTQVEAGTQWAVAHGYSVDPASVYRETHSGEELHERPELTRLRDDAKSRRFAIIVSNSIDRLSRDAVHLGLVLMEMDRLGVRVEFVTEQLDDSPDGQLLRMIRSYAGKIENMQRVERYQRAIRKRAYDGKLIPGIRPTYGYAWGPEVYPDGHSKQGQLTKQRLVVDPVTSAVVVRVFERAAAGHTLRKIALDLNADSIPTPTGKTAGWSIATVRYLLNHPTYRGEATALRSQSVPVSAAVRAQYVSKSRQIARAATDTIPLPAGVVEPLVSSELAALVAERLVTNKQKAHRKNKYPERSLLRGGFVRCGTCGHAMGVWTTSDRKGSDTLRTRYMCRYNTRTERVCTGAACIEAGRLDAAVWREVCRVLRDPDLIAREVEQMRATDAPGAETLSDLDRQLAAIAKRIRNKHKYAELVEDDAERTQLAAETALLLKQQRAIERQRAATAAHYAHWHEDQAGLERVLDWTQRVAGNLDSLTYAERRDVLRALHVDVQVWRADHTPRVALTITLPLSGVLSDSMPLGM